MATAIAIGVPLGIVSAVQHDRWPDQLSRLYALLGVSVPAFWLAILLQLFLGLKLDWFAIGSRIDTNVPAPEAITGLYILDSLLTGNGRALGSALSHIVLPAFTLAAAPLATITRMTRASMLEVLGQDYVRLARAKGLAEHQVLVGHALKNAFIPTLTMIGLSFGWLMGGSVLVESVFDWPGIGLYAVKSTLALDFMPIMGIALLYGIVFSLINIGVDVLYGFVDPRIRHA
jgi:peptide/nickel transport system permease protein